MRVSTCGPWPAGFVVAAALFAGPVGAQLGPQNVVREFCRLDAIGARVTVPGWARVAPLVQWTWEPAWDRVFLITSYTVGWPVVQEEGRFAVEVRYALRGVVTALGLREQDSVESRVFHVEPSDGGVWRIVGPPPPPHVFFHDVDVEMMSRSLAQGWLNFVSNSLWVHGVFRQAGWDIPLLSVSELARGEAFREVQEAKGGDLILYFDGDEPYHVGVLEQEGVVVSATLNAGVVRTSVDAFPGTRKALRLVEPMPTPIPTPVAAPSSHRVRQRPTGLTPVLRTPTPRRQRERDRRARKSASTRHSQAEHRSRVKGRRPQ